MAGQRRAEGLAGVGVPQPHGVVGAGGGQPVPIGTKRHPGHCAGVIGEDLQGAGPLNHRVVENTVVGGGERAGGQNLLESPCVAAGSGVGQHALGLRNQPKAGRLTETRVGPVSLVTRLVSLIPCNSA